MTTKYEGELIDFKEILPLLPVRDIVIYPFMILPLFVGRESSILAVKQSLGQSSRLIVLAGQKDISAETPLPEEIYSLGTVAMIMREKSLPDGRIKILIQGLAKVYITNFLKTSPYYEVHIKKAENVPITAENVAVEALMRATREKLEKFISLGKILSPDILMILEDIQDPGRLADLIASNLNLRVSEAQTILETLDPIERLHKINHILNRELEIITIQNKIQTDIQDRAIKTQKESLIREQIRAIKSELGEENGEKQDEFADIREKISAANMPTETEKEALKNLSRLERMHPESSEASILRNYLECLLELPWSCSSQDDIDLGKAKGILDEDHFDLEKVKERILEYLAVKMLKGKSMKGPILCFMGPPGVGKTSLGKSIARAMGRNFVRISLGGIKDEAEIRGHRRTYVGAMPGRFVQALQQAGTNNPIIMLDEVDKLGADFRGDPSSALLEVLDPEQNHTFRDHYINVPFDLSNTMFIATANSLENIPHPLRDRMEILHLTGYTEEEKLAISKKFLIPKQGEENGVNGNDTSTGYIEFDDDGIVSLIRNFTSEAGLRALERHIGAICRKVAKKVASGNRDKNVITPQVIEEMLGPPLFNKDNEMTVCEIGVATGLAWTAAGGEIIQIEARKMKGVGLTLTGQLGDIMKESAKTAVGYIRGHSNKFGTNLNFFENHEIHIHIPAGATPKDGPSAGITLATAIISLVTNMPVDNKVAMTGEITLTGKVLPVGGVKEKALAAMRHGIKTIIIPWGNKKDLVEIPPEYQRQLTFICVKNIEEVFAIAVVDWPLRKIGKNGRFNRTDRSNKTKKKRSSPAENNAIPSAPPEAPIAAARPKRRVSDIKKF